MLVWLMVRGKRGLSKGGRHTDGLVRAVGGEGLGEECSVRGSTLEGDERSELAGGVVGCWGGEGSGGQSGDGGDECGLHFD